MSPTCLSRTPVTDTDCSADLSDILPWNEVKRDYSAVCLSEAWGSGGAKVGDNGCE